MMAKPNHAHAQLHIVALEIPYFWMTYIGLTYRSLSIPLLVDILLEAPVFLVHHRKPLYGFQPQS